MTTTKAKEFQDNAAGLADTFARTLKTVTDAAADTNLPFDLDKCISVAENLTVQALFLTEQELLPKPPLAE